MKPLSPLAAMTFAAALGLCAAMPAAAQSSTPDSGWEFELTPYFWMTALKGETQINNLPQANINMSFSDVWNMLDFGLMGTFEARKGRWGLFFDGFYAKMSDSGGRSTTLSPGPGQGVGVSANASLTLKNTIIEAAVEYRVIEGSTPVDLFFGARYNEIDIDATVDVSALGPLGFAPSRSTTFNYSKNWVDPYIGVRVMHPVAAHWTLVGYYDFGGFGVGSDFTWQALAGVKYEINKTFSASAGYRFLHIDYNNGGFLYDMDYKGAYLALGIKF